jgi:hypothetical protein
LFGHGAPPARLHQIRVKTYSQHFDAPVEEILCDPGAASGAHALTLEWIAQQSQRSPIEG